ncbi:hypothetical protein GJ744_011099 [Endocarpon pusillum]|uniref:Uncharacterized protein n=1 Tax=Endocarpon pusillum TaxID=364733 RepID=A0A8H7E3P1_9EURO|nr:hypothetical protein GJ744_011099 [Endocarpon pusillum]
MKSKGSLEVLPDEDVHREAPSHLATVSIPIDSNVYIKRPKLSAVFVGTGLAAKLRLVALSGSSSIDDLMTLGELSKRSMADFRRSGHACDGVDQLNMIQLPAESI